MTDLYDSVMRKAREFLPPRILVIVEAILACNGEQCDATAFELACGLYWGAVWNYEGQGDPLYELQCSLDYSPGMLERGPEEGSLAAEIAAAF